MKQKPVRVLHIDTGREWRGGQQQSLYLLQALHAQGLATAMVCQPRSPLAQRCADKGLPHHAVAMAGEWDLVAAGRIAALCRGGGYAILHAHTSHATALCSAARGLGAGSRLVVTRRLDFHVGGGMLGRWKNGGPLVDRVACISEGVRCVLLADGLPERKLRVIHDGADLGRFAGPGFGPAPGPLALLASGTVLVGTVAALTGHKDYPTLLRAARMVLDRCPAVTFCALGEGEQRAKLAALHHELKLGGRFIFAGFQDDPGPWLKRLDVFVLSSKEEGLGSSILDAQALGIPVAATRAGGIPDVIVDGETGLLCDVGDAESLAAAIVRLVNSPEERLRLGRAGRRSVERFSVAAMTAKYSALYEDVLGVSSVNGGAAART